MCPQLVAVQTVMWHLQHMWNLWHIRTFTITIVMHLLETIHMCNALWSLYVMPEPGQKGLVSWYAVYRHVSDAVMLQLNVTGVSSLAVLKQSLVGTFQMCCLLLYELILHHAASAHG